MRRVTPKAMKDTYYFQHDYNARNDPKLQEVLLEHGVAGVGVFWCVIEQLYEQGGKLPHKACKSIAFALHVDCKLVESVVKDFDLFKLDARHFWSKSVIARLDRRKEVSDKRKTAAASRWKQRQQEVQVQSKDDAIALQELSKEKESKGKETKGKETKGKEIEEEEGAKTAKRFCPPTLEEVKAYCAEKEYNIDAERFIDFYTSKGWFVGKNKMKDWQAAVRNWHKGGKGNGGARTTANNNVNDEWR